MPALKIIIPKQVFTLSTTEDDDDDYGEYLARIIHQEMRDQLRAAVKRALKPVADGVEKRLADRASVLLQLALDKSDGMKDDEVIAALFAGSV